ncbi:MAG: histidine phosphatase family protein [Chloroflexi bacterium]|nr:histidine phosphatase family protein [Chloroflexota bacterium]
MGRVRRLILIRHCQATGQEPDAPLTVAGLRQAESLRDFLAGQSIDAVVASEYRRATQTVEPLAAALGLAVRVDARLNERKLSEKPIDHWREIVRDSFGNYSEFYPNPVRQPVRAVWHSGQHLSLNRVSG